VSPSTVTNRHTFLGLFLLLDHDVLYGRLLVSPTTVTRVSLLLNSRPDKQHELDSAPAYLPIY